MTVREYYSSDAGAPALRGNTAGDLINLLWRGLVTGYGSKDGAGWTRPFLGTNVAVFRAGAGSSGMYLRVDDTSTATSNRAARVVGYENMTDVNTGGGPFPTAAQESGGMNWFTHAVGTVANARSWALIADEAFFILAIQTYPENEASSPNTYRELYWFGDIVHEGAADTYATIIKGRNSVSTATTSQVEPMTSQALSTSASGLYAARSYTGLGGSIPLGMNHDSAKSGSLQWGADSSLLQYPHGPNGALLMSPLWVHEPNAVANSANIRGVVPGIWVPLQGILNNGDTFDGQGDLTGKSFRAIRHNSARAAIETTNTWR